jgi:hypothetical protein
LPSASTINIWTTFLLLVMAVVPFVGYFISGGVVVLLLVLSIPMC